VLAQGREVAGSAVSLVRRQTIHGKTGSHAEIMRSRSTFAMMEAAAMDAESASP